MDINAEFTNEIRQNVRIAENTVATLLEIVTDVPLRQLLQRQHTAYRQIAEEGAQLLEAMQAGICDTDRFQRWESEASIRMKTVRDKTPDRIAELRMKSSLAAIISLTRRLKQYGDRLENEVRSLANRLLQGELHNLNDSRLFLG